MIRKHRTTFMALLLIFCFAGQAIAEQKIDCLSATVKATRITETDLDIYYPRAASQRRTRLPLVVLSHGFARAPIYHANNALYLASQGYVVAVPMDINAETIAALVQIFAADKRPQQLRVVPPVDTSRIALAGHSAGGAASISAAALLQKSQVPVRAVCMLDGVPFPPTWAAARELRNVQVASFRAEPAVCNANGLMARLMESLDQVDHVDLVVPGSTHCDQEDPSDILCGSVCGRATKAKQREFRSLMSLFLRQAFERSPVAKSEFRKRLEHYQCASRRGL